ncbi:HNH endonuclease [Vreelandella olivaria]|uniref:HNH endonuclease n=1 Tax=Vreelandella olivaria TaxID=390919 RepID=UPI00201F8283|nr:HNH endonuclease [Halomonas olivaria]
MKIANLQYIDPDRPSGLAAGGKLDREIWEEFAYDRPRLRQTAAAIREVLSTGQTNAKIDVSDDEEASEGRTLTRLHKSKERNRALVKKKKAKVLKESGKLACEACSFDFTEVYGAHGEGFIECHHTRPLHTLDAIGKTKLSDLALLCANCHRMVHAKRPWLTIEQLQKIVTQNLTATSFY